MHSGLPQVVIVGRPNVGKSSLLNLLARRRISIVDAMAGVTRDRISAVVELPATLETGEPVSIELIDTGGHGIVDTQDLTAEVERQIAVGVAESDLILFVVDAQSGVMPLDQEVAQLLRTSAGDRPVVLVANKVDGPSHEPAAYESLRLGFGEPVMVSAANSYNKIALADAIVEHLPSPEDRRAHAPGAGDDGGVKLAIVGKRNAGKSTLVNALAGSERVIVSEKEGTTRDSVDVRFEMDDRLFTAIDTAGARKLKSIKQDIEFYSHHRALRSIRRADVVLLLIDAALPVSQVDAKLGHEVLRHYKPCVVVVNKWDLAEKKYTQEQYLEYLDKTLKGLAFAPIAFISAERGEGMSELVETASALHAQAGHRVTTGELNRVAENILAQRTPVSKVGKIPKVYYVTQSQVYPPTIAMFVNRTELFDAGYERFFINRLRDELPFPEVPIRLVIRPHHATGSPRAQSS
jgi:GTP-binding protein